jgi:hypothetical protein
MTTGVCTPFFGVTTEIALATHDSIPFHSNTDTILNRGFNGKESLVSAVKEHYAKHQYG